MIADISPLSISFNGISAVASVATLGFLLTQHKVWVRMKDRLNTLWWHHAHNKGEHYTSVDDGK